MSAEQLRFDTAARRAKGAWERRAEQLLRTLRSSGHLDTDTAGYGDALRMAGRDRDRVEHDPEATTWSRVQTRQGWDQALSRIVAPPTSSTSEDSPDDPFAALEAHLSRTTMGDAPTT